MAKNILANNGADRVNTPRHESLVRGAHIDREYAVGLEQQPFESQPDIAQRVDVAPMTRLTCIGDFDSLRSTVGQSTMVLLAPVSSTMSIGRPSRCPASFRCPTGLRDIVKRRNP